MKSRVKRHPTNPSTKYFVKRQFPKMGIPHVTQESRRQLEPVAVRSHSAHQTHRPQRGQKWSGMLFSQLRRCFYAQSSVSTRVNCQPSWRRDKIGPSHQISSFQLSELKGRSSETASSSTKLPEKLYISPQRTPPRFRWIERLPNWPLFSDLLGLWLQTFSVQSQHNQRVRHISMMTFATHKSQRFTWFFLDQNTKYNDFKCTQTTPLLGWQPHPLVLALPHSQGARFQQQSVPWNKISL